MRTECGNASVPDYTLLSSLNDSPDDPPESHWDIAFPNAPREYAMDATSEEDDPDGLEY